MSPGEGLFKVDTGFAVAFLLGALFFLVDKGIASFAYKTLGKNEKEGIKNSLA